MTTVRVAIVDDHPMTREGVAALVAADPRFEVVASLDDPAAVPRDADVVVLDLYLADGKPSTPAVAEISTWARVLVMSASRAPADVLGVVRAGASGYVTKDTGKETLLAVLATVAAGGFSLSPQLADVLTAALAPAPEPAKSDDLAELLSPREREALDLIAAGFTHAQAAKRMSVTKATVDTYVERIRGKLQAGNKAELTRIALAARQSAHGDS